MEEFCPHCGKQVSKGAIQKMSVSSNNELELTIKFDDSFQSLHDERAVSILRKLKELGIEFG